MQARIGYSNDTSVWVYGAKGKVCSLGLPIFNNGVEEGGLADVGQADDAGAEAHANPRVASGREPPCAAASAPLPAKEERRGSARGRQGRGRRHGGGPREAYERRTEGTRHRSHVAPAELRTQDWAAWAREEALYGARDTGGQVRDRAIVDR